MVILEVKRLVKEASHGRPVYLGFAHGLAGHLFALEMSRACFGSTLNSSLREQCIELIAEESRSEGNRTALWASCSGHRDLKLLQRLNRGKAWKVNKLLKQHSGSVTVSGRRWEAEPDDVREVLQKLYSLRAINKIRMRKERIRSDGSR